MTTKGKWMKFHLAGMAALALVAGGLLSSPAAAAETTYVVTPADMGGDWYPADTRPPGTGTFENGPASPPLGTGSYELQTLTNPEKVQLFTDLYDGIGLDEFNAISYWAYRDPASTGFEAGVAALNMRVSLDGDESPDAYMVYEPYQDQGNAAVQTGVWQEWDAFRGGAAKWWINTGAGGCGQATPCTFSTILSQFPDATVAEGPNCGTGGLTSPCPGSLGFNQGSFNSGIISNVDALTLSTGDSMAHFDFELVQPDTDGDGVTDDIDNCPGVANPDQADTDGDTIGDACEADSDGDGVIDDADNCPADANADQADLDGDSIGDACDSDRDGDGVNNGDDAFPDDPSESADSDSDGIGDNADNCDNAANPDQADTDQDGAGDACDTKPFPTTKDECKNGGWMNFNGIYTFKNQGACVSFVTSKKK